MSEFTPNQPGGGQEAGDPRYELLRDPLERFLIDAEALGQKLFHDYQNTTLFGALPGFTSGLYSARVRARKAQYHRSQMPVIDEVDLEDLKADLAATGVTAEPNCHVTIREISPSQCQIYVDKSVTGTAKFGVAGTREFLRQNHLVLTQDGFIVDGHHRWLTGWTIDPEMIVPAFRIPEDYIAARPEIMRFSDARHPRNL